MTTPQPGSEPSTAAQLIDALLAGGQPIDEGSFSLDTAAAAAKLDAFQYADRDTYLIPIAEAACGLGARKINLTTRGGDLLISFECVELPQAEQFFADPFAQLRGADADRTSRALGRLGVGLHMAVGHAGIECVGLSHSSASQMLVAEYRRGAATRLARQAPEVTGELRIFIVRPWTARLPLRGAGHAELEHLHRAVEHSNHVFELDGRVISGRYRNWDYSARNSGAGFRYQAGLESKRDAPAEQLESEQESVIELWSEDVCVETLPGPGVAFQATIHLEAPRRDLSQMKIVHDSVLDAALQAVEASYREALATLASHDAAWATSRDRPRHWPPARVDRVLGRPVREPTRAQTESGSSGGFGFGLAFYMAGNLAGAIGSGMIASKIIWGWVAMIFLFSHGLVGADAMAKALCRNSRRMKVVRAVLFGIGIVGALAIGLSVGSKFR